MFKYYRLDKTPDKENVIKTMKRLLDTIDIITICTSNILYDDVNKQMHHDWNYQLENNQYDQIYDTLFEDYTRFVNRPR
jgi:hypothetical protein